MNFGTFLNEDICKYCRYCTIYSSAGNPNMETYICQIDGKCINKIQKVFIEQVSKIKELELQIEKMKCCENCEKYDRMDWGCHKGFVGECMDYSLWEIEK